MEICENTGLVISPFDVFPLDFLSMPEGKPMNFDNTGAWPVTILGKMGEGLSIIDKISAKRFSRAAEAEEAAAYVLEKLSENSWKRCTSYKGNAQPQTYLIRLTKNLLEDFSRKKYGRLRPPKWVQDSGKTWVELWTELCKESRPQIEIVPRFMQRGHDRDWIKSTIKIIKATRIPNCGQKRFEAASFDDISSFTKPSNDDESVTEMSYVHSNLVTGLENPLVEAPSEVTYAQQGMAEAELLQMVHSIAEVVPNSEFSDADHIPPSNSSAAQKSSALTSLGKALVFKDSERAVLKMRFKDGLSISAVAKALKLKPYDVTVIETNCLKRIREAAISVGLDLDSLLRHLK